MNDLMKKIGLPEDSRAILENTINALVPKYGEELDKMSDAYFSDDEFDGFERLDKIAEAEKLNPYTVSLGFLVYCAVRLNERRNKEIITDELFFDAMRDLKYKNDECLAVKGVTGTFVRDWFRRFFQLTRFSLGRFQYETVTYAQKPFGANGFTVSPGDTVINIHIPYSGAPITDDIRMASYKKAYNFYSERLNKRVIPFMCFSWLLYNKEGFFPKNGNIFAFQKDFHIIETVDTPSNDDVWRIFLTETTDYTTLPENSSLQRHLKNWLLDGKCFGEGVGVFFFDGENIF